MNTQFKKNCLMEIYTECDESFLVGFYLSSFDEYSLFHLLDEQGKIDGIYLIKNKFIKNTNYETEYLEKINLYAEFWKINSDKNIFNIGLKQKNISNIGDILKYIKENKIISSSKIAISICTLFVLPAKISELDLKYMSRLGLAYSF